MSRDLLAPPGIGGCLQVVVSEPDEKRSDAERLEDETEREFSVWCTFSRGGGFSTQLGNIVGAEHGDSFFQLPANIGEMRLTNARGEFVIHRNERREYSGASARIRATSSRDARAVFLAGLTPALDHWSYVTNTPIHINDIVSEDVKNNITERTYTSPYTMVAFQPGNQRVDDELIPLFGLYREAKNSRSPFYRFLCYFKILEAVFDHLRPKLFVRARALGVSLPTQREVVPDHPELRKMWPQYVGKPIKQLVDNELAKEYRNAVAHFLRSDGEPMNPSDSATTSRFSDILLITELSARTVIEQQGVYYNDLEMSLAAAGSARMNP